MNPPLGFLHGDVQKETDVFVTRTGGVSFYSVSMTTFTWAYGVICLILQSPGFFQRYPRKVSLSKYFEYGFVLICNPRILPTDIYSINSFCSQLSRMCFCLLVKQSILIHLPRWQDSSMRKVPALWNLHTEVLWCKGTVICVAKYFYPPPPFSFLYSTLFAS